MKRYVGRWLERVLPATQSSEVNPQACPHCAALLDHAHRPIGGLGPGDVAVCYVCQGLMVFDEGARLVAPDPQLAAELAIDPGVVELQHKISAVKWRNRMAGV